MLKIISNLMPGYPRILKRLAAAGLSRVLEHMWKGPFGIISASRGRDDDAVRTKELKNLLKQRGYGFIDLQGGYLYEDEGQPKVPVREDSVFLPNISEPELQGLASQFNQESYIFGDKGRWSLKTQAGEILTEGLVEDTFESLRHKMVGEDYPFMSQMRGNEGRQFRLDPDLVQRRKEEQEQLMRRDREQRVAFRLVGAVFPCFYSIAGEFRPQPPVCLAESNIMLSGACPDGSLLECWLPLQAI